MAREPKSGKDTSLPHWTVLENVWKQYFHSFSNDEDLILHQSINQ